MASISHYLCFSSTLNVSATSSSSYLFPLSPKPCQPSKHSKPKRHHVAKVACNSSQKNPKTNPEEGQLTNILGNRRNVLIGLGGLCGAATLSNNPLATAEPVAPDLKTCGLPSLPAGAKPTKCCPPPSTEIIDFKFPTNQPLRLRKPAHSVNGSGEDLAKYEEALRLMKALPSDDPRSFTQQANIHCAYCHNSYHQAGHPKLDLQVHFSWLFLPFHRWYLYFYERILGSLINDPTFALPFWNWDTEAGMEIPGIYTDTRSPLYNPLRNANHQPPVLMDLNWNKKDVDTSGNVEANLKLMYTQIVDAKKASCFHGKAFRGGQEPFTSKNSGGGTLELRPHNIIHTWSGDNTQPNTENMGSLYSAGRDPLFYSHHSNVDRMWNIWQTLDGGRKDFDDTDWLDSSFLFYDENKNLVRVFIRDSVDSRKLGYDYFPVDIPWLTTKPTPRRSKAERVTEPLTTKTVELPVTLGTSPVSTVVKRPKRSMNKEDKGDVEEVLVIDIKFDRRAAVKFDVLINDDDANPSPLYREFAGSFVNVTHTQTGQNMLTNTSFTKGISDLLKDLEADDDDSIVVTLVPQYGDGVIIEDIKINLETC